MVPLSAHPHRPGNEKQLPCHSTVCNSVRLTLGTFLVIQRLEAGIMPLGNVGGNEYAVPEVWRSSLGKVTGLVQGTATLFTP